MSTSNVKITQYIIDKLSKLIELSEFESKIIEDSIACCNRDLPNSKSACSARVDELINHKASINYMLNRVKDARTQVNIPYRQAYELKFVQLTRMSRPSREAIISEIHTLDTGLRQKRETLESLDQAIEILQLQSTIIDNKIRNIEKRSYDVQ